MRFNIQKFLEVNSIVLEKLNEEQQNAVLNWVISTNFHIVEWDAKIVQIKIIIALLEILRKSKLRLLIASSKNDSLDSLLVEASEQNVSFVRVANKASEVDTRIKDKVKIISSFKSYQEIDGIIKNENIYATTWLGSQHGILRLLNPFDIWIIEDADWISEPVALCSLVLWKKFIMVGKARNSITEIEGYDGLNENLFQRLARICKDEISQLR